MDCLRFEGMTLLISSLWTIISGYEIFAQNLLAHFRILITRLNIFYIYVHSLNGHHTLLFMIFHFSMDRLI